MDESSTVADRLLSITTRTQLQANELSLALGTVGRGASATNQSLDSMLVSMGLVRNTGVQASVAASSVSSALLYMSQNADRFSSLGISITDSGGRFRDFNEIVLETADVLRRRYSSDADRAGAATRLFGRFGITAFQAISTQATSGIRDLSGAVHTGADAIDSLMESTRNSQGVAEDFQRRVLDNFPGRMQLLSGTVQTLGTVVGQTFGTIFMPIIDAARIVLNRFIEAWRAIPESVQQLIGVSTLAAGAFAVITGAIGTITSLAVLAISLLGSMIVVIGAVMAGISVAMAPVIALFGALVAVGVMLRRAWQQNLGGLADFVEEWSGRIKMLWDGLEMVMTRGFLGGDLLGDMMDAGEDDMVGFLITVGDVIADVRTIWSAFSESFAHGWELLGPIFRELGVALGEVLDAVFAAFGGGENSLQNAIGGTSGNRLQEIGQIIARYLLTAIRETVKALIVMARVLSMTIRVGTAIAPVIVPALTAVYHVAYAVYTIFATIFRIIGSVVSLFQAISPQLGLFHRFFGERIGRAVGGEEGAEAVRGVRQFSAWNRPQAATGGGAGRSGAAEGGPARVDQTINLRSTVVVDGRELAATQRRVRVEQDSYNGGIFDEGPQSIPEG
jgi:TP901 family phage tail tape measure protein